MNRPLKLSPLTCAAGIVLALAAGFTVSRWTASASVSSGSMALSNLPVPVFASASQGHDNFVIATGLVNDGVEAIFFLDFLTGDLKATVINERQGGGFNSFFEYNIAEDFDLDAVRNPKYLMVTGMARNVSSAGVGGRLSDSILYVVEASTGQLVAYGLPWNAGDQSAGIRQQGTFIPIARTSLRNEFVRDQ